MTLLVWGAVAVVVLGITAVAAWPPFVRRRPGRSEPPPGWYTEAGTGDTALRWWDGTRWSSRTFTAPAISEPQASGDATSNTAAPGEA